MGGTRTLTLSNRGSAAVTYDLSDVVAISTGAQTFAPLLNDFWLPETTVTFSAPSVTVPAGGTATVGVTIAADPKPPTRVDGFPDNGLYGGYLVFTDHANPGSVYRVPYAGFKGDYQSIVAMPTGPVVAKRNAPFEKAQQTYAAAAANEVWTLASPDEVPNVLIHFDHQVRLLELQVVDAARASRCTRCSRTTSSGTGSPGTRPGRRPEARTPRTRTSSRSRGTARGCTTTARGQRTTARPVPDGQYKIVARALKALGDPANPADWEVKTSSTITIDRP